MYQIPPCRYRGLFILSLCFCCQAFAMQARAQWKRFSFTESKMGSPLSLIIYETSAGKAQATANRSYMLVDSLVEIYSDYIEKSELNLLSRSSGSGQWIKVSPAMLDILLHSRKAYRLSNGAFDITTGPLVRRWRIARREKTLPEARELEALRATTGFNHIRICKHKSTVKLKKPGMQLDLGGIAQGYIAGKILELIRNSGAHAALVDVSGDIVAFGHPPEKSGWTIGINIPEQEEILPRQILLKNAAVSTSGDVYQYLEVDGKRYSHIVDPKTGYGLTNQRNVTVIARDPVTADWMSTACSILPFKNVKRLAKRTRSEYLIGYLHDDQLRWVQSEGFKQQMELKE